MFTVNFTLKSDLLAPPFSFIPIFRFYYSLVLNSYLNSLFSLFCVFLLYQSTFFLCIPQIRWAKSYHGALQHLKDSEAGTKNLEASLGTLATHDSSGQQNSFVQKTQKSQPRNRGKHSKAKPASRKAGVRGWKVEPRGTALPAVTTRSPSAPLQLPAPGAAYRQLPSRAGACRGQSRPANGAALAARRWGHPQIQTPLLTAPAPLSGRQIL